MIRTLRGSTIFLFCVVATACKPALKALTRTEAYIIGDKNQIRHDLGGNSSDAAARPSSDLLAKLIKSSVLIVSPMTHGEVRFCSGAVYNTDEGPVVLTNRHCFASVTEHKEDAAAIDPWACIKTQVFMNFDFATSTPETRSMCEPGSLRSNQRLDVASFKLKAEIPENFGLNLRPSNVAATDRIQSVIVHFPDVAEQRVRTDLKKFPGAPSTMPRIAVTYEDCHTAGYFSLNGMTADPSLPYAMKHTCDMIQGSSGSALVDAQNGDVLGVNWGGIKYGESDDAEAFNIATRAPLAISFLKLPEEELTSYLSALADSPPPELVGDGSPDAHIERSSKSSPLSLAGCAKIAVNPITKTQGTPNDDVHGKHSPRTQIPQIDLSWLVLAGFPGWFLLHRLRRRTRQYRAHDNHSMG